MTAQAGAILNTSSTWDAVDWRTIEDNVRRLQARIVKAVQQKKWNKVKALQHLLTHSASGKLLAVRRVTVNDGRKTPGVDGELCSPARQLGAYYRLTQRITSCHVQKERTQQQVSRWKPTQSFDRT
jgi:RNA-directed DNA polymerase